MAAKAILILCAQALFIQTALSQCANRAAIDASGIGLGAPYGLGLGLSSLAGPGLINNGLVAPGLAGRGLACDGIYSPAMEFTATSGGGLAVTSSSAIAPTGITIVSENVFEGPLSIAGDLPFVGTTGMEGAMPSAGAGAINHACGNGVTAMVSDAAAIGLGAGAAIPPIAATFPAVGISPAASFQAAGISPAAAAFAAGPMAGRFGLGGCAGNIVY